MYAAYAAASTASSGQSGSDARLLEDHGAVRDQQLPDGPHRRIFGQASLLGMCCPAQQPGGQLQESQALGSGGRAAGVADQRVQPRDRDRGRALAAGVQVDEPEVVQGFERVPQPGPGDVPQRRGRGQRARVQQQLVGDRRVGEAGQQPQHLAGLGQRPGIEQVQGQVPGPADQPAGLLRGQLPARRPGTPPPGHRPWIASRYCR